MTEAELAGLLASIGWAVDGEIAEIGAGAWSTAYGFVSGNHEYVIRVGAHVRDFRLDEQMAQYASPLLPIPKVHGVGPVPGTDERFYCISSRVHGSPMEDCPGSEWAALAESLADVLEGLRAISPPEDEQTVDWQEQLLDLERGALDARLPRWRSELATSRAGQAAYDTAVAALERFDAHDVPITLLHGDLINRNVFVTGTKIAGIFDWGCQRWGDHLFELDWLEFWAPWHQNLDVSVLESALTRWWDAAGYAPTNVSTRRTANQLQIGIDHLAYNASVQRWSDVDDVVERMEQLQLI